MSIGDVLLQTRHAQVRLPDHFPGVGRNRSLEDLEKGRLPGAIAAEEPETFPVVDLEIHRIQEGWARECEAHVVQADQHEARTPLIARVGLPDGAGALRESPRPAPVQCGAHVVCLVYFA